MQEIQLEDRGDQGIRPPRRLDNDAVNDAARFSLCWIFLMCINAACVAMGIWWSVVQPGTACAHVEHDAPTRTFARMLNDRFAHGEVYLVDVHDCDATRRRVRVVARGLLTPVAFRVGYVVEVFEATCFDGGDGCHGTSPPATYPYRVHASNHSVLVTDRVLVLASFTTDPDRRASYVLDVRNTTHPFAVCL